jgi:hypothetical protein
MYKICLAFLLTAPVALYAQSYGGPSSSSSMLASAADATSDGSAVAAPDATPAASPQTSGSQGFFGRGVFAVRRHDTPQATFTASYVYQYAPNEDGANRSLMGWSATPEVNFTKYLGLQAEFTSLYMRSVYPGQSRLMMAAGPRFTFAPHSKMTPFVFAEAGQMRSTQQLSDVSDWNTVATGGIGVDYKLTKGVAFQLIPGEYVAQQTDSGDWNHTFMTKAGITFNLYR